jgi:hypothetical protein
MKKIYFLVFSFIVAVSAYSQERVLLNDDTVSINSDSAILVRTNKTPSKVKITMQVPMGDTVCERQDIRLREVTSGSLCGYNVIRHEHRNPVYTDVCLHRNPFDQSCVRSERQITSYNVSYSETRIAKTCVLRESYCAQYGVLTSKESDGVVLKFKKATVLDAEQEESFSIRARQNHVDGINVLYDIQVEKALKNYDIKSKGFLGSDRFVIQGN